MPWPESPDRDQIRLRLWRLRTQAAACDITACTRWPLIELDHSASVIGMTERSGTVSGAPHELESFPAYGHVEIPLTLQSASSRFCAVRTLNRTDGAGKVTVEPTGIHAPLSTEYSPRYTADTRTRYSPARSYVCRTSPSGHGPPVDAVTSAEPAPKVHLYPADNTRIRTLRPRSDTECTSPAPNPAPAKDASKNVSKFTKVRPPGGCTTTDGCLNGVRANASRTCSTVNAGRPGRVAPGGKHVDPARVHGPAVGDTRRRHTCAKGPPASVPTQAFNANPHVDTSSPDVTEFPGHATTQRVSKAGRELDEVC